jgi:hypothetical protein
LVRDPASTRLRTRILRKYAGQVVLDGSRLEAEPVSDLFVAETFGQVARHLPAPRGENQVLVPAGSQRLAFVAQGAGGLLARGVMLGWPPLDVRKRGQKIVGAAAFEDIAVHAEAAVISSSLLIAKDRKRESGRAEGAAPMSRGALKGHAPIKS